ncbi:MAG TPA: hypothetical protein VF144_12285 [Chitinophagaceae bacterium]
MFQQTWKKYLPVILLLMKRSDKGQQVLDLSYVDFQRATGGKKTKLSFSKLRLENGRTPYDANNTQLAKDLILALQENELTGNMLRHKQFEFSVNSDFQLTIRNVTVNQEVAVA